MNKAFVREPDPIGEYCPGCGAIGETVRQKTLQAFLTEEQLQKISETANFCSSPSCKVVYFDMFERSITTNEISVPVYPKDLSAPICACFGLTRDDIEQDVSEGVVRRVKSVVERSESIEARCEEKAVNGRRCVAWVQKYYMQCRGLDK